MHRSRLLIFLLTVSSLVAPCRGVDWPPLEESTVLISEQCVIDPMRRPEYTDPMWILDSVLTSDLVVRGTPRRSNCGESACLDTDEIVCGDVDPWLVEEELELKLVLPNRVQWDEPGHWLLMKTVNGYYAVNPESAGLSSDQLAMAIDFWQHRPTYGDLNEHWSEHQIHRTRQTKGGKRPVWHGPNVSLSGDRISIDLMVNGTRVLTRSWNQTGQLTRIVRRPCSGRGFFLQWDGGHVIDWGHFRNGKRIGLRRKFFRSKSDQIREGIRYVDGVRDGLYREFNRDGTIVRELLFRDGLIAPVVKPNANRPGSDKELPTTAISISDNDVSYIALHPVIDRIKVGMTAQEVADILGARISPAMGVMFETYHKDMYLAIVFENGRVSAINTGHNGVCIAEAR